MKLTKGLLISFFTLALCQSALSADKKPAPLPEIGRYQLFQGRYSDNDLLNGRIGMKEALFMLDTVSGVLFVCDSDITVSTLNDKISKFNLTRSCKPFDNVNSYTPEYLDEIRKSQAK